MRFATAHALIDFVPSVFVGFVAITLGLSLGAGCAAMAMPDACDPGLFTARMQALALECRTARLNQCPGVSQESFERDVLLCPAALECYHAMDQEALSCVGK